jgi:TatD DNase family protein
MATDAHCHPYYLGQQYPEAEADRRRHGVMCAASAWNRDDFLHNESLSKAAQQNNAPHIVLCFGVHPQLPAAVTPDTRDFLSYLETLSRTGRINAVGEIGFDLYNDDFRKTETLQDELFAVQLEFAIAGSLPVVLHVRKAIPKIFAYTKQLKKVPAVIFHSWSGTCAEGNALIKRGINAFFSFGTPLMLNHKEAMRSCAYFPAERLLLETDAPYQPARGKSFSCWDDLTTILHAAACLRNEPPDHLSPIIDRNFASAYSVQAVH